MANIINISEAAAIALHSMALIASSGGWLNAVELGATTGFSKNHISKVLSNLVKSGLLESGRGPAGGFRLVRRPEDISLIEIFETVEGRLVVPDCANPCQLCEARGCIFGGLSSRFTAEFADYLRGHRLSDFVIQHNTINTPKQ